MIGKDALLEKLDKLKNSYRLPNNVSPFFEPVEAAIESYFAYDSQLEHDVQYTIHQLALDLVNRGTTYENWTFSFSEKYPDGYEDVSTLFTGGGAFSAIIAAKAGDFNKLYIITPSETESATGGSAYEVTGHTLLEEWEQEIAGARASELAALGTVASFCESGGYNVGLVMLFEDLGDITSSVDTKELADRVYVSGGYKEVIEAFGLDVHIATSVRG